MAKPRSFLMILRRKYRVYLNQQTGYWFVSYTEGNKRIRTTLGVTTKPDAEAAVEELDRPRASAKTWEVQRLRWQEFQNLYLEYKTNQGLAPKSVARYKASLDAFGRHLKAKGVEFVDEISLVTLEGYVPYRTKTEQRDVKTAYNDTLTIKNAFKWGSKASRKLLEKNPALDWEVKEPVKPKRRMYSPDDVSAMEVGVRPWLRPVIITLAWSGLRIGELLALRWKDVDLDKGVLHVRVQEDWKPKGRRDRTVPLHPKVRAIIEKRPLGKLVFTGPKGGALKQTYILACLKVDQRKLKLPEGDLHGFRRFFATQMMQAGVPVETVRQWGGWQSLDTMLRYLADTDVKDSVDHMAKAAEKLKVS